MRASVTKISSHVHTRHRPHRPAIIDECKHALEQLHLQSRYPGRPEPPDLPQSEWSPYVSAFDDEE